jgi:hypothetical protein
MHRRAFAKMRERCTSATATGRFATALLAASLLGCASEKAAVQAPDIVACSAGWRTVFSPPATLFPGIARLALHGDRLYYGDQAFLVGVASTPGFLSVSTAGGLPVPLLSQTPNAFWIEGDQILFVPILQAGLSTMPIAGGPVTTVFEHLKGDMRVGILPRAFGLDRDALYWTEISLPDEKSNTFWRGARDGSAVTQLAQTGGDPMFPDGVTAIDHDAVVLDDAILIADRPLLGDVPLLIPKQGGAPVKLPTFGPIDRDGSGAVIIGAAPDGTLLWSRVDDPNALVKDATFSVGRSGAHGPAPAAFWPGKPRKAEPSAAWPAKDGGWLVALSEEASDHGKHVTLWSVDVAGNGTRLGCDPQVGRQVVAAAVGPDVVYLGVRYPLSGRQTDGYWELGALPSAVREGPGAGAAP